MRTVGSVVRAVVALVGPPVALLWWQGWPLPDRWPDTGVAMEQPLAGELVASAVAVVGWLVWLTLLYVLLIRPYPGLRRAAQGLRSLTTAAALLVGMPIGLVWWAGWPLPDRWPSEHEVGVWLAEPDIWPTAVAGAAVLGWLCWLGLLYAAIVEVAARAQRMVRWVPSLPLPTPLQGLAGGVLGAAAVSGHAGAAQAAAPPADVAVVATLPEASAVGTATTPDRDASVANNDERDATKVVEGVVLPDGTWLPRPIADAVAAAAAFVWSRRRQLYLPQTLDGSTRSDTDTDLAPLPATVLALQTARQATTESTMDPGRVGDPADAPTRGAMHDRHMPQLDLPAGGVGLVGPGAVAAARAIVGVHLLGRGATVVTTTADLRLLLASEVSPLQGHAPGLRLADDVHTALTTVEHMVLDRATTTRKPVVMLVTSPADEDTARRLAVLLTLGHERGVAGILLGDWPAGATWQVDADGHTRSAENAERQRLGVLTAAGLNDLLTLQRLSDGDRSDSPPRTDRPAPSDTTTAARHPEGELMPTAAADSPAMDDPPVMLTVLGRPSVHSGGSPVAIRRSAGMQILTLLAVHSAGATGPQLTAAIWPHLHAHTAASSFHTTISELRRTLRAAAGGHDIVLRSNGRYHLDAARVTVDLWRLRGLVTTAATARQRPDREAALWAIVDAFTGELAAGCDWAWLAPHREAARRDVIDAYTSLATIHPDQAARLLLAACRVDPINAHLHQQAAAALRAAGNHAAAGTLIDEYERQLARLGLAAATTVTTTPGA